MQLLIFYSFLLLKMGMLMPANSTVIAAVMSRGAVYASAFAVP